MKLNNLLKEILPEGIDSDEVFLHHLKTYMKKKDLALLVEKDSLVFVKNKQDNQLLKEQFAEYILQLNFTLGKNYRQVNEGAYSKFKARMKEGFTLDDFFKAIKNASVDQFHRDNGYKHITPEFLCRHDKLEKFLNAESSKINSQEIIRLSQIFDAQ